MKSNITLVVCGLSLIASFEANAVVTSATIDYAERFADQAIDTSDYQASWKAQTSSISTRSLSDFYGAKLTNGSGHGSVGYSYLKVGFDVSVSNAGNAWAFKLAPDAGLGGAIYLDGTQIASKTYDLWWDYDYNNADNFLTTTGLNVSAGHHTFEGYWAEQCCNGGQVGLYSMDGKGFLNLSEKNLNLAAVPEPEEWLMMIVGFSLLGLQIIRKKANHDKLG